MKHYIYTSDTSNLSGLTGRYNKTFNSIEDAKHTILSCNNGWGRTFYNEGSIQEGNAYKVNGGWLIII